MTPELQILLGSIAGGAGALLSYWAGWRARDKWDGKYNFSHLNACDKDNAAFDAWQDIKQRLKEALAEPTSEGV